LPGCKPRAKGAPRIAIVGGGIAGLQAAHVLAKGGLFAEVFEAGARAGGRMLTLQGLAAPGLWTEAGGEFIDSDHEDMIGLAGEFGLTLQDAMGGELAGLVENAWHFGGRARSEAEVAASIRDACGPMAVDIAALPDGITAGTGGRAAELDKHSLAEYLDRRGVTGWLRDLITAAYVSEFGLDAGEQSCLNLLTLVSLDISSGRFRVFGDSDERFRIQGGSQALTDAMASRYGDRIRLGHRLEAIEPDGEGYKLTFQSEGNAVERKADAVILALPFTLLRSVDLRIDLTEAKRKAIRELGYGTNSKLFLGYHARPWRKAGYAGTFFTDGMIQNGWDHTRTQPGPAGGITIFQGGSAGLALGNQGPSAQAQGFSKAVDAVFPGSHAARNGSVGAFHWPTYPWSLGSYACYKVGQWTGLAGEEFKPAGGVHFAGEHCSLDFQGYMNGGAETGRRAAEAILAKWKRSA
jgi:monoamine oxidase